MALQQPSSAANPGGVVISLANVYQQRFDFPPDVIKHILANASYNVVKKLYFTCKYFPSKYRLYLIDGVRFGKIYFSNDSFATNRQDVLDSFFARINKIWFGEYISTTVLSSTKWFPKIDRSSIKKLEVLHEDLLWNDFKKLAAEGTIEELSVKKIVFSGENQVALEDICALMPNMNSLEIMNTHVTPNTMAALCTTFKSAAIEKLYLYSINSILKAEDYLKLLKEHGSQDSLFSAYFSPLVPLDEQRHFMATVECEIEKWPEPKPSFQGIYTSF